ncbi:hypothetical protein [Glaciimonas sp. PAMC28666]|uniref:hypothetical protein n=1 Tax=Glaciimonas sp. PAMC28666 TaxID=2807626 RepID=UPI001966ACE6|nr:hypothetical protein [Glaciimonas sp. PAMC28666]QRX82228.1 hypothetical protein JQN73_19380 [Glaciimonas sp. PAMC28666]
MKSLLTRLVKATLDPVAMNLRAALKYCVGPPDTILIDKDLLAVLTPGDLGLIHFDRVLHPMEREELRAYLKSVDGYRPGCLVVLENCSAITVIRSPHNGNEHANNSA